MFESSRDRGVRLLFPEKRTGPDVYPARGSGRTRQGERPEDQGDCRQNQVSAYPQSTHTHSVGFGFRVTTRRETVDPAMKLWPRLASMLEGGIGESPRGDL